MSKTNENSEELIDIQNTNYPNKNQLFLKKNKKSNIKKSFLIILTLTSICLLLLYISSKSIINSPNQTYTTIPFKNAKRLGIIYEDLNNIKYSFDKSYLIGINKNKNTLKLIDAKTYKLFTQILATNLGCEVDYIKDFLPLPDNKVAVIEEFEEKASFRNMNLQNKVIIYKYGEKLNENVKIEKEIEIDNANIQRKCEQLYYLKTNELLLYISSKNNLFKKNPKSILMYNLTNYKMTKNVTYNDCFGLKFVDDFGDYMQVEHLVEYVDDHDDQSREIKIHQHFHNIKNNFFREFERIYEIKPRSIYGEEKIIEKGFFYGTFLRKFTFNKEPIYLYKLINEEGNNRFYKIVDRDKPGLLRFEEVPEFGEVPGNLNCMVEYDDRHVLFGDGQKNLILYNFEKKTYREVYIDFFDPEANFEGMDSFSVINSEVFAAGFNDGKTILYTFEN